MRVISGIAKGRILIGPKSERIRPALDKVKGAIFNILYDVEGKTVLDLFAGTGSIGIEALSRGADRAVFVDSGEEALRIIRKNLELCRFENVADVLKARIPRDLARLAKKFGAFDLVFVDPPYDQDLVNATLAAIAREKLLAPSGIVVVEHSPREMIASEHRSDRIHSGRPSGASDQAADPQMGFQGRAASPLTLNDQRKYGQTWISFLNAK